MQRGRAAVWSAETGLLKAEYSHQDQEGELEGSIVGGHFGPDSKRVVTCAQEGTVAIWSFANGEAELVRSSFNPTRGRSARFNGRGDRVVTWSDDGIVELWSATEDRKLGQSIKLGGKIGVAKFSPDPKGKKILTACADGTTRILDGLTGAELGAPIQHASDLNWVAWHPGGYRFITVTVSHFVGLVSGGFLQSRWSAADRQQWWSRPHFGGSNCGFARSEITSPQCNRVE